MAAHPLCVCACVQISISTLTPRHGCRLHESATHVCGYILHWLVGVMGARLAPLPTPLAFPARWGAGNAGRREASRAGVKRGRGRSPQMDWVWSFSSRFRKKASRMGKTLS